MPISRVRCATVQALIPIDPDNGQKEGAGAEGAEDGRPELARHRAAQP